MNTFKTLTIVASLITAFTTVGASAAILTHVPNQPKPTAGSPEDCSDLMGFMRSVRTDEIAAINHQPVVVIPVCEDLAITGRDNYGSLFIDGNAEKLRMPIARNSLLMSVLASKQYDHHDVVSVRFGANDSVILYVHQRTMR
jgi:hypothetical protein